MKVITIFLLALVAFAAATEANDGDVKTSSFNYYKTTAVALVIGTILYFAFLKKDRPDVPPMVPYSIPIFGHALEFGKAPIDLLYGAYKKFGEIFRIKVVGHDFTFLVGPEAHEAFYTAKEEELSAKKAYSFTIPVFGKNVVYDSPDEDFQEQRMFAAKGLSRKQFKSYVKLIQEETEAYLDEHWKDEGSFDLFQELNYITIVTSTRSLQGSEVRARFNKEFADLYLELDKALGPISFFFPHLPIPVHARRDQARAAIGKLYEDIIKRRRASGEEETDFIQTLLDASYSDGREITEEVITGLCVGLLLAGQHTSNVTSTWLGIELLQNPEFLERVRKEQEEVIPLDEEFDITFEKYRQMELLERSIKETIRLHPPIMAVFRKAEVDWKYKNYVVPKGSLVGVSPSVSLRIPEVYEEPDKFNPDRFLEKQDPYTYVAFSLGKHACIGEKFAYLQVAVIWSVILRRFDLELVPKEIKPDFTTMIVSPTGPVTVNYKKRNI